MAKALKWDVTSDGATIGRMQQAYNRASGTLRQRSAILAASCVLHMLETGNATPMTRFVHEAGEEIRKDAVVKWALGLGPFKVSKAIDENTKKAVDIFEKDKSRFDKVKAEYEKDKESYGKNLVENPFFSIKQANPFKGVSVPTRLYALKAEIEKVLADPDKANHPDNDFRMYEELKPLFLKYEKPSKKNKKAKEEEAAPETIEVPVNAPVPVNTGLINFSGTVN